MASPNKLSQLRGKLMKRRKEVFKAHGKLEQDRRELGEPEVEFEESAQIDPLLWQREDRTPGKEAPRSVEGVPVEEERQDAYTSRKKGVPFIPPDGLLPEEKD
jgi:hypothetical protein